MRTRIGSFVSAIVSLLIAGLLIFVIKDMGMSTSNNGLKALALLFTFPVYLIIYALLFGSCFTAIISSIKGITSSIKFIRIASIILLILALAITGLGFYLLKGVISI